jgi:hypothetical protein
MGSQASEKREGGWEEISCQSFSIIIFGKYLESMLKSIYDIFISLFINYNELCINCNCKYIKIEW